MGLFETKVADALRSVALSLQLSMLIPAISAQSHPRQVFWLDDENLLYTDYDVDTGQTWVRRIQACIDCKPLNVYGR